MDAFILGTKPLTQTGVTRLAIKIENFSPKNVVSTRDFESCNYALQYQMEKRDNLIRERTFDNGDEAFTNIISQLPDFQAQSKPLLIQ